jgi:hypothetical protein
MKRTLLVLVVIGVASLLVSALSVFGQPSTRSIYVERQVTDPLVKRQPAASAVKSSTDEEQLIDELAIILKETKSPETFLVTAMTLGRLGPKARRTLPVVIRNAERLELLEGLCDTKASSDDRAVFNMVVEVIEMILGNSNGVRTYREHLPSPQPVCYPATPAIGYALPSAVCPNPSAREAGGGYPALVPPSPVPMAPTAVSPVLPTPTIDSAPRPPSMPKRSTTQADERLAPVPCTAP